MLDRTIPYKSLIMCCNSFLDVFCEEPEGILIRTYQSGDEKAWAKLECELGDFKDTEEAELYFERTYGANIKKRNSRCFFACTLEGKIVGSCIAWHDKKETEEVASLHWLVVAEEFQNRGIGKALLYEAMRSFFFAGESPVYLHTQTWSYKAIDLYSHSGFFLLKKESFSDYKNEYEEAIPILKEYVSQNTMIKLLHEAEEYEMIELRKEAEEKRRQEKKLEAIERQRRIEEQEIKSFEWRKKRWKEEQERKKRQKARRKRL